MRLDTRAPLLLIGDAVEGLDRSAWTEAFTSAGWRGSVRCHEHPGRMGGAALLGGHHDLMDPVFSLGGTDAIGPEVVVVGVGRSGLSALLCGLGGRALGVVLVDGLGGPFESPSRQIARTFDAMRAVAADDAALGPAPPGRVDPRLAHVPPVNTDRRSVARMMAALPVPLLVLQTPASPLDIDVVRDLAAPGGEVRRLDGVDRIAAAVVDWAASADQQSTPSPGR